MLRQTPFYPGAKSWPPSGRGCPPPFATPPASHHDAAIRDGRGRVRWLRCPLPEGRPPPCNREARDVGEDAGNLDAQVQDLGREVQNVDGLVKTLDGGLENLDGEVPHVDGDVKSVGGEVGNLDRDVENIGIEVLNLPVEARHPGVEVF